MAAVTICSDFGAQKNKVSQRFQYFPIFCHEVMGANAMILVFWILSIKPTFSLSSLVFIRRLFSSSLLSVIRVVSSAYLRLLIYIPATLIPAVLHLAHPAFLMVYSAYKLNKQGDNIQPWCTPFPTWNQSVVPCPVPIFASWPAYRLLKRQVRWSGIPISFRIFQFIVIHTVKGFGRCFSGTLFFFWWSSRCWQFDFWFLFLFWNQLEHLEVHGSCVAEAWLAEFWALVY